jgi:hypothetical protein
LLFQQKEANRSSLASSLGGADVHGVSKEMTPGSFS